MRRIQAWFEDIWMGLVEGITSTPLAQALVAMAAWALSIWIIDQPDSGTFGLVIGITLALCSGVLLGSLGERR